MADTESSKPTDTGKVVLEAWSQGFMIGAIVIMCAITLVNMRRKVLLHKLILVETLKLILAVPNGFFMFFDPPAWGWFLSSTVVLLITSWTLHNIIAWMKNKPFLGRRGNFIYITSVLLVQPYWILEIYANFAYFNGINSGLFLATRPYEAVFRYFTSAETKDMYLVANEFEFSDPWWIFTIGNFFWNVKFQYELSFIDIIRVSPRFGILLSCMCLSIICVVVDLLSVTPVISIGVINPFWKFAFVFKCLTDSIILDDFKTALDKLSRHCMGRILPCHAIDSGTPSRASDGTQKRHGWPRQSVVSLKETLTKADAGAGSQHLEITKASVVRLPSTAAVNRAGSDYH